MVSEDEIIIRLPQPGELGWIIHVHGRYYAEMFGWYGEFECIVAKIVVDYLSSESRDRQACFIAELNGQRVGSIMLTESGFSEGKLRVLFVTADARGKGIGSLLIKAVLHKAAAAGYESLSLWTTNNQKTARELYKKFGFAMVSSDPNTTFARGSNDEQWKMYLAEYSRQIQTF